MSAERVCGRCTACCVVPSIKSSELWPRPDKPSYVPCSDLVQVGKRPGCSVYEDRPGICRQFRCAWLQSPGLPDELRPDRCGVLAFPGRGRVVVAEVREGALAAAALAPAGRVLEAYLGSVRSVNFGGEVVPVERVAIQLHHAPATVAFPVRGFSLARALAGTLAHAARQAASAGAPGMPDAVQDEPPEERPAEG